MREVQKNFSNGLRLACDIAFSDEDKKCNYQPLLTGILDNSNVDFTQNTINEIVLWKLNRYAVLDKDTLKLLNSIKPDETELDEQLTRDILLGMLGRRSRGFRLPMASTVLHFRNRHIYQIIDQRVYRLIYGGSVYKEVTNLNDRIVIYIRYLRDLRTICEQIDVPFEMSSRWLYNTDKRVNRDKVLEGYGTRNGNARAEE
jgi:hypothetical protein